MAKTIKCACGCGESLVTPNRHGYPSKFVLGHNSRTPAFKRPVGLA